MAPLPIIGMSEYAICPAAPVTHTRIGREIDDTAAVAIGTTLAAMSRMPVR